MNDSRVYEILGKIYILLKGKVCLFLKIKCQETNKQANKQTNKKAREKSTLIGCPIPNAHTKNIQVTFYGHIQETEYKKYN